MRLPRLASQQPLHGHLPVAGIASVPVRHASIGVDAQMIKMLMQVVDGLVRRVAPWQGRPVRQRPLPGVLEDDLARSGLLTAKTALVDEAMVLAAQLHQVVHAGLAASAPVLDVMRIDEMLAGAARKPATVVAKP